MSSHHRLSKPGGEEYVKVKGGKRVFRRLMSYWLRHWKYSAVVIACLIVVSVLQALPPLFIKRIFDEALNPPYDTPLLLYMILGILGATALSGVFGFFQRFLAEIVSQRVIYQLRKDVYESLQRQSFAFFDRTQTGQLMSRTTMDVDLVRRFLSFGFRMIASSLIGFVVVIITCIFVLKAPGLTLLGFSTGPLIVYAMRRYSIKQREPLYLSRDAFGSLNSALQENLTGIEVVSAYNQHEREKRKFQGRNSDYFSLSIILAKIRAFYGPMPSVLIGVSMVVVLLYGGSRIVAGALTLGTLIAFNAYLMRLTRPLSMLGNMTRIYQDAIAGGKRVFEIIDQTPEVKDSPDAKELGAVKGRVEFGNVTFSYGEGPPSLQDVSFEVQPGETVILLGGTGSGKSTIVNLIPRFYDPTAGKVMVDGTDLRDVTIKSLRKVIGIVPQETFLFSTTIKENIAYGRPNATDDEIEEAAKLAEAHDFIMATPKGYDTEVGERGVTLSGGEKQRIAIARALLMDPKILILDDSTSSVDTETEYQIQRALDALLQDRTTFIITQRLSMIRKGNRIIVMDRGRLAEQGTHDELIRLNGIYRRIYDAQSGGCLSSLNGGGG